MIVLGAHLVLLPPPLFSPALLLSWFWTSDFTLGICSTWSTWIARSPIRLRVIACGTYQTILLLLAKGLGYYGSSSKSDF